MTRRKLFLVTRDEAGERLDDFLASQFGSLSRTSIRKVIDNGPCRVNGKPSAAGYRLMERDLVEIDIDLTVPNAMRPEPIPLDIRFEDERLAVVNKPAGMLVHPTPGVKSGTLANALAWRWNRDASRAPVRPVFVNRLDRPVSGLVIVSKSGAFRAAIHKSYAAIVSGRVEGSLTIEAPIGRVSEKRPHWGVSPGGKPSESRLTVVEARDGMSLVELIPVTGRTNQLRIHCAHIGHPILGDADYGGPAAPRLCLHAARVEFRNPEGDKTLRVEAETPREMSRVWEE